MKPTFERSVDVQVIARKFATMKQGDFLSYKELEALLPGTPIRGKSRWILASAVRVALGEHKIVIGCVANEGMKRLTDEEISDLPEDSLAKIRRHNKRTGKRILCAEYDKLSAEAKIKLNIGLSMVGALDLFTAPRTRQLVEGSVKTSGQRLNMDATLKLLG